MQSGASKWTGYYTHHQNSSHHELLEKAVQTSKETQSFAEELKTALDLGCGTGRDTTYLLDHNYCVTAVDPESEALRITKEKVKPDQIDKIQLAQSTMEDFVSPKKYDLVSANLAIPFVHPDKFQKAWSNIAELANENAVVSIQFFGKNHVWAQNPKMTFHNKSEVEQLFEDKYKIVHIEESDKVSGTVSQGQQRWHQIDVIALRKAAPKALLYRSQDKLSHEDEGYLQEPYKKNQQKPK